MSPSRVLSADWSVSPRKCIVAAADRTASGWHIDTVGVAHEVLPSLLAHTGTLLWGVDVAIGLPSAWGRQAGVTHFLDVLPLLGHTPPWHPFPHPAETLEDISLHRPFFPMGRVEKGTPVRTMLAERLGIAPEGLFRRCDLPTGTRGAASPLFTTVGGQQVGKASLAFWQQHLQPGVMRQGYRVWPFSGALPDLLQTPGVIVAECYPAEAYRTLGLVHGKGALRKRLQEARRACAGPLLDACAAMGISLSPNIGDQVTAGWGPAAEGEDPFDAFVGLLGLLTWDAQNWRVPEPTQAETRALEGWIIGQEAGFGG